MSRSGFISYIVPNEPENGFTLNALYSPQLRTVPKHVHLREVHSYQPGKQDFQNTIRPIKRIKTRLDRLNDRTMQILKYREFTGNWDLEI